MPLTRREAQVISAYTGFLMSPTFGDVQEIGDEVMGRPTWTHEYASEDFIAQLREGLKAEFLAICQQVQT